jgi:hypothetical protein
VGINSSAESVASVLNVDFYLEDGGNSFLSLNVCPEVAGSRIFSLEICPEDGANRFPQNDFIMLYHTCVKL